MQSSSILINNFLNEANNTASSQHALYTYLKQAQPMNQQQEQQSTFERWQGTVSPKQRKHTYQEETPGQQNRSSSIASHHRKSDLREHGTEARQRMN
jgi:hypothetical protein